MRISLYFFCIIVFNLITNQLFGQASFTAPDTVCVNMPVKITNTSVGGNTFLWNFCSGGLYNPPQVTNLGNIGGLMNLPVFLVTAKEGPNYYAFYTNNIGNLVRLSFGTSLLNTPVSQNLGTFGGLLTNTTEGLQVVKDATGWHIIIVGGNDPSTAKIVKLDLGNSLANAVTGQTDWGNIGSLNYPVDLYITQENGNWYGFTVNYYNNTVTRFEFGTSFSNIPVATNFGNLGVMDHPTGIFAMKENGEWHLFVTNEGSSSITRLDLGTSLSNTPTGINLGNPDNVLNSPRDLSLIHDCGNIFALAVNRGDNSMVRIDFKDGINSQLPFGLTGTSIAANGNFSFPHSISTVFREGNNLYAFITNAYNNTLSRLVFSNCNNSSIPSANTKQPPVFSYNQPGTYTINLLKDEFTLTESAFCKNIVVLPVPVVNLGADKLVCDGTVVELDGGAGFSSYKWNTGETSQKISVDQPGVYEVEVSNGGCTAKDQVQVDVYKIAVSGTITDIDCNEKQGAIKLAATGGTAPYTFSIDGATPGTDPLFDQLQQGSYTFKVTDKNGCATTSTLAVNIAEDRLLKTTASSTPPTCNGTTDGTITINVQKGVPPFEYAIKGQPFQSQPVLTDMAPGNYMVYTRNGICLDSAYLEIVAPGVIDLKVLTEDDLCDRKIGKVLTDIKGGTPPYDLYWEGMQTTAPIENLGAGSYDLKILDVNKCSMDTIINLVNNIYPRVQILNNDIAINMGETISLTAVNAPDYEWTPAESLSCATCPNPIAMPLQNTTYIVTTKTGLNCIKSDTLNVTVSNIRTLYVPNAFTPNNDGINDVFRPRINGVAKYHLAVYNRWGEMIFETNNTKTGWDGRYKSILQPIGAYVYFIQYSYYGFENQMLLQKGAFTLLK
ncbi:gliding motility-associated-like protein [Chitinophaga sp. W3I9]